jgi:hypothetical protein
MAVLPRLSRLPLTYEKISIYSKYGIDIWKVGAIYTKKKVVGSLDG